MSKTITNDEGEEEVVFTQAELDAQLLEKDTAHKAKLDEFLKGKTSQELQQAETKAKIEEMEKKHAEEIGAIRTTVTESQTKARNQVVDFLVSQVVGADVELKKKLAAEMATVEAGYKALGKDINDNTIIQEIIIKAAQMAGVSGGSMGGNGGGVPNFGMFGGVAPSFADKSKEGIGSGSEADNAAFKAAVGYKDDPKPKKE